MKFIFLLLFQLPVIVGGGLLIVLIGLFTVNLGGGDKKPEEK